MTGGITRPSQAAPGWRSVRSLRPYRWRHARRQERAISGMTVHLLAPIMRACGMDSVTLYVAARRYLMERYGLTS
jgi:hypothetical protein